MPPNGFGIYSPAIPTRQWGYDPSLAEEFADRQRQYQQQQLQQMAQAGQITAEGITEQGKNFANAITNGVQGYYQGKKLAQDEQAGQQRQALAEEELKNKQANDKFLDTPDATGTTLRQRQLQAPVLKTEEETDALKAKAPTDWQKTEFLDKEGHPILLNPHTGEMQSSSIIARPKSEDAKPQLITTVDDQGNPIQKFVTPTAGASYAAKPAKSNKIPAAQAAKISKLDSAINQLDNLQDEYNKGAAGFGSSITGMIPGSKGAQYDKVADVAAQTIGTSLEGKALTDKMYTRYHSMIPSRGDPNDIAAKKTKAIADQLLEEKRAAIASLQDAGFDTSGFAPVPDEFKVRIGSGGTAQAASGARQVMKKEYSPSRKSTRITYSDGTTEILPDAK